MALRLEKSKVTNFLTIVKWKRILIKRISNQRIEKNEKEVNLISGNVSE